MLRIFNAYFTDLSPSPVYSFLHKATVIQRYHAGLMDRPLLYALVGITTLLSDVGMGMEGYGSKCIDLCQQLILSDLDQQSVINIQALVLVIKYRMMSRQFVRAFMLLSLAARMAYGVRLNFENPRLCFLAQESRRRLMWSLFLLDGSLASGLTDFQLFRPGSIHVQLPCDERHFELNLARKTEMLQPPEDGSPPDDIGLLALNIRISSLRYRILHFLKTLAMSQTHDAERIQREVYTLQAELDAFVARLPSCFAYSRINLQLCAYSPRLAPFIMIHILRHQCHCDLYRLSLAGLHEALPQSVLECMSPAFLSLCREKCFQHAEAMVEIYNSVMSLKTGLPSMDLDFIVSVYQCARILFYLFRTNALPSDIDVEHITKQVNSCAKAVAALSRPTAAVLSIQKDLDTLLQRGFSNRSSSASPEPDEAGLENKSMADVSRRVLSRHSYAKEVGQTDHSEALILPQTSEAQRREFQGSQSTPSETHVPDSTGANLALPNEALQLPARISGVANDRGVRTDFDAFQTDLEGFGYDLQSPDLGFSHEPWGDWGNSQFIYQMLANDQW
ncbi:hypothetical protein AYL99_10629 [Fonsecaea erecta]|uniref:Xylanolytic transcriptional activator regulatory domain-containing protein n=1 Tax=Fonsecaea erecta TaxID=1367422 RepID=A0A178Z599_9EURO|nr:hypothetical protein AYL99_10629 [Fonsecaea erecta]OAP54929.1 hypothetical protein AYL99_10629 [Fonsecaea erecta]